MNFGAKYTVWGKKTSAGTAGVYSNASRKYEEKGLMAVQAQEYMATPFIQKSIAQLPKDTFVRLHTGVLEGDKGREDSVLGFVPYVSFEASTINEQIAIAKKLNGQDNLKLSLDETGNLNKEEINKWLASVLNIYR